ncbi:MAG: ribokinase [Catenulispora sp.]|nr:ribokinase [Catenulispora sp.]
MDLSVRVPRLPRPGETVTGSEAVRSPGGKGGNQAVAAARLGPRVQMIGMVGGDPFGVELRRNLEAEGVDVGAVGVAAESATGMALIVVQADGENTITLSPGANALLSAEAAAAGAAAARDAAVLLMNLEVPLDAVLAAAQSTDALRVLNAAPVPKSDLSALLRVVDVLVVNETEAAALLGEPVRDPHALLSLGPRVAVLTLGAAGAVAVSAEGVWKQEGFAVEAVDAVGAGDAFCAALAVALGAGTSIQAALRRACAAGAIATTRFGAQAALPSSTEVDQLLSS